MPTIRNVLLMLSSAQPPPPEHEVASLAERAADGSPVALVTTRHLAGLTPGESTVALYGDAALDNRLLGCGTFDRVVPIDGPAGRAVLAEDPLYALHGRRRERGHSSS